MATSRRTWDPNKVFDATVQQKKAIEERARMRAALKAEWKKKVSNPYRGVDGYIVSSYNIAHWTYPDSSR